MNVRYSFYGIPSGEHHKLNEKQQLRQPNRISCRNSVRRLKIVYIGNRVIIEAIAPFFIVAGDFRHFGVLCFVALFSSVVVFIEASFCLVFHFVGRKLSAHRMIRYQRNSKLAARLQTNTHTPIVGWPKSTTPNQINRISIMTHYNRRITNSG